MKKRILAMVAASFATTISASAEILKSQGTDWDFLLFRTAVDQIPIDPANFDPDFHSTWYDPAALGYNGPAFTTGAGYFGYGTIDGSLITTNIWNPDGSLATNEPPSGSRYTAYFVTSVTPTQAVTNMRFSGIIDDGAIIYVNGAEVARVNMTAAPDAYLLFSDGGGSETVAVSALAPISLAAGVPVRIGVSVHQTANTSSDIGFDLEIESVQAMTAPNDDFADAIEIVAQPPITELGTTGDGVGGLGSTREAGEPDHAGETGGGSVWWTWTAPASGRVSLDTDGSSFNTALAVYTGSAVNALSTVSRYSNLNVPASSGAEPFWPASRVEFDAVEATTYSIAVSGLNGESGDVSLTLDTLFSPLDPVAELLPAGSSWEYLLYADLGNQPVDPETVDPDFDTTWHTKSLYDGPVFSGPAPALLGYGTIDGDPIVTDIWGGRDHGGLTPADNLIPPTDFRYAAYFRTSVTPTEPVLNLAFEGLIDDGAVIYVNGVEAARINLDPGKDADDWMTFADGANNSGINNELAPQLAFALDQNLPANQPVEIAVSLHNPNGTSSDMGFDLRVWSSNPPLVPPTPASFNVLVERTDTPGEYQLSWPSVTGAIYDIDFSEDLETWIPIIFDIPADPSGTNIEIDFPAGIPEGYYRVIQR